MVVEISPLNPIQLPSEPLRPWRLKYSRPMSNTGGSDSCPGLGGSSTSWTATSSGSCRRSCTIPDETESESEDLNTKRSADMSRAVRTVSSQGEATRADRPGTGSLDHVQPPHVKSPPVPRLPPTSTKEPTSIDSSRFTFVSRPRNKVGLDFHVDDLLPGQRSLKRARPATDVDGPNTSGLSCKKRRLRLELITSRLSQPFSLPATHILNREGLARGDKRFLKMATHADMVRRGLAFNSSSSPFRRVAVLNRTRMYVRDAHLNHLSMLLARTDVGRNNTAPPYGSLHPVTGRTPAPRKPPHMQQFAQTLPTPAAARRSRSPVPSPPASPRPRPVDLASNASSEVDFDEDMDGEAFPMADHASLYDADDSDDDVYSDFAAIFSSGASSTTDDDDEHSYEEYLDELDGLSWSAR